jgi:hypothetical protein
LILGAKIAALSHGAADTKQECKPGNGEVTQNRTLNLKHPSTHKFPDLLLPVARSDALRLMPFK